MATRSIPLTSFDRLAANFFDRPFPSLARQIPVDAVQRNDELVLKFDLPGVTEDQVDLSVERRVLTVKAERSESIRDGDNVFLAERPWGSMTRQVVLGDSLDLDHIEASFDHGVLTVTVPMSQQAMSRKIEIGHAPVEVETSSKEVGSPQG